MSCAAERSRPFVGAAWTEDTNGFRSASLGARVDVWVDRGYVRGWLLAYLPPAWALRPELAVLRVVERYERWCQSLKRQTPRAVHVHAHAVRLMVNGNCIAICGDPQICEQYGLAQLDTIGTLDDDADVPDPPKPKAR